MSELVLAAFTRQGTETALKIAASLGGRVFAPEKYACGGAASFPPSLDAWVAAEFSSCGGMIFVSACGIAVRLLAPFLTGKAQDPAVVVTDELGRRVVSLLSGHLGGANALARAAAAVTGGEAVITTATDVRGLTAVDQWARDHGCAVENLPAAKAVSSALLDGKSIGVAVTDEFQETPWPVTLWLRPRRLVLGAGCKRGVAPEDFEAAAAEFLRGAGVSPLSLAALASLDLKRGEKALLEFAERHDLETFWYGARELAALKGVFSASARVLERVGVDNVCERAAFKASGDGGVLLRSKTVYPGITLALCRRGRSVTRQ